MPLYEYQCLDKGHSFEVRHPITQDPVLACPVCGSSVRRVIFPVGIVFKGSGFYATDSRGKGVNSSTKPADGSASDSKSSTADSKTTDAKSESKKPKDTPPSGANSSQDQSNSKPAAK